MEMKDAGFVQDLRHSMLALHKALLDAQRIRYEREHGRIATSGEFLGLVLEHPAFAWLRALSALIARIDEWLEEPDDELPGMIEALRSLIETEGRNAAFSKPYWDIVNAVPEVLIEHVKLWRLLQGAVSDGDRAQRPGQPRA